MTHVVVFISDPSRIEIHDFDTFNDNYNDNYRRKNPIVYTELTCGTEDECIEFCKKHKLSLTNS